MHSSNIPSTDSFSSYDSRSYERNFSHCVHNCEDLDFIYMIHFIYHFVRRLLFIFSSTFFTSEIQLNFIWKDFAFLTEGRGGGGGEKGEKWVGAIDRQANNGHSL